MPRPHHRNHVAKSPSIQPSIIDKPQDSSPANHPSPILNRSNQIIEIINDSSSPPSQTEIRNTHSLHLPPLLANNPAQTAHTMSSEHQRTQYQPQQPETRRRFEERRHSWEHHPRPEHPRPEHPRPEAPRPDAPPSQVFHLKQTTIYNQPYAYTFNNEPLYLQFGTHGSAEAARMLQSVTGPTPPTFADPRYDYRHYGGPRNSRQYEDERYAPYDGYRNYESYDGNRDMERRGSDPVRREDEYEQVRYRHSTGQGGPVTAPAAGPGSGEGCQVTEEYEREEDDMMETEKPRQRLPTTRTYRDFSRVPSVSGQSEDRKRYSGGEELPGKRVRLNWSDDLHTKFLAAVEELGVEKAVPTSIMKLMKVDGLTRENVASHLQKYRGTIRKEKEEEERRLLLKAAAKSVLEDGGRKLTEEEVIKAVAEREEGYNKAPAKKRSGNR